MYVRKSTVIILPFIFNVATYRIRSRYQNLDSTDTDLRNCHWEHKRKHIQVREEDKITDQIQKTLTQYHALCYGLCIFFFGDFYRLKNYAKMNFNMFTNMFLHAIQLKKLWTMKFCGDNYTGWRIVLTSLIQIYRRWEFNVEALILPTQLEKRKKKKERKKQIEKWKEKERKENTNLPLCSRKLSEHYWKNIEVSVVHFFRELYIYSSLSLKL